VHTDIQIQHLRNHQPTDSANFGEYKLKRYQGITNQESIGTIYAFFHQLSDFLHLLTLTGHHHSTAMWRSC